MQLAPLVEVVEGFRVVRDDLVPGGTKARVIHLLFDDREEYVYAGPCVGYAQVALAYACRERGKRATLFCAKRGTRHQRTLDAIAAGAAVHEVDCGYLTVVKCRAEEYCEKTGAVLMPFGLDAEVIVNAIANVARLIPDPPREVWSVAGSGTLSMALQEAWPSADVHAVLIGKQHERVGRARLWVAPEKFEQDAKEPPPYPSCGNYDAKLWQFVRQHASPGALVWNVAS